jgi:hypothetical protein
VGDCISWRFFFFLVWSRSAIALSEGCGEILGLEWQGQNGVFESSDESIGSLRIWNLEGIWGVLRYESSRQALFTRQHIISTTSLSSSSSSNS